MSLDGWRKQENRTPLAGENRKTGHRCPAKPYVQIDPGCILILCVVVPHVSWDK